MIYEIHEHNARCWEIIGVYRDGFRASLGTYTSLRNAKAELKLIREAS